MKKRKWYGLCCIFIMLLFICGCEGKTAKEYDTEKLIEIKDKDYIDSSGNFLYYREGDKKFYGYMDDRQIAELTPQLLKKEITFHGVTGILEAEYCTYKGETWVVQCANAPVTKGSDEYDFFIDSMKGNDVYLKIVRNAQQNEWNYPLLYNLETGEITNYLKDVKIKGTALSEVSRLNILDGEMPEETVYASCDNEIYKIDVKNQEAVSLNELVKEEAIEAFQILEDGYFLLIPEHKTYKGVYFDVASEKKEVLFEDLDTEGKNSPEFIRMEGNDALLIKKNGKLYCRDQNSRKEWNVEGWEEETCVLGSRIKEKVLLLGKVSCGILDLKNKTYREIMEGKDGENRVCRLCDETGFTVCTGSGSSYTLTKYRWKD